MVIHNQKKTPNIKKPHSKTFQVEQEIIELIIFYCKVHFNSSVLQFCGHSAEH